MNSKYDVNNSFCVQPPLKSRGVLSDIFKFFFNKPCIQTLIEFKTDEERENYTKRILQRLGQDVLDFSVLNIHKIGINAPLKYVFEELSKWNGDSTCWPNHIATVDRIGGKLEQIDIFLLGKKKYPFGFKKSFLGLKYIPLFRLNAIRIQQLPDYHHMDNARFLLYNCSGGYPIGIFSMYVRSPIASQGEKEDTQLFLVVSFNFYGKKELATNRIIDKTWQCIHNRVTCNIMNRFKQLCEWRFQKIMNTYFNDPT